MTCFL